MNFGSVKIGETFQKRTPNSGLAVQLYGPMQIATYEKMSGSKAKCIAQEGFGNERMVGGHYSFGYNSSIFKPDAPLRERIFKITKRACLNFDDSNPGFVAIRNGNWQQAKISVMRLVENGFQAKVSPIDKTMIIIEMQVSAFGKTM